MKCHITIFLTYSKNYKIFKHVLYIILQKTNTISFSQQHIKLELKLQIYNLTLSLLIKISKDTLETRKSKLKAKTIAFSSPYIIFIIPKRSLNSKNT